MKKQNQIERKNSRGSTTSQGKKPETKRVRVSMPLALKEAVRRAAKKLKISPSRFLVLAIREEISRAEIIRGRAELKETKGARERPDSLVECVPSAQVEDEISARRLAAKRRIVRVRLSQLQGSHMRTQYPPGSIKRFAQIATDLQLIRLQDATPIVFEVGNGGTEDTLIAVRRLRRNETREWERAKVGYAIIASELKKRGL